MRLPHQPRPNAPCPPLSPLQLASQHFDQLFVSPLTRCRQTADIIWAPRPASGGAVTVVPQLREVDLYSFQVGHCGLFETAPPAEAGQPASALPIPGLPALLWSLAPAVFFCGACATPASASPHQSCTLTTTPTPTDH